MKWFRKQRLSMQLAVVLIISLMSVFATFTSLILDAAKQMQQQEDSYVNGIVNQLSQNVQQNYVAFNKISRLISYNRDVQNFLLTDDETARVTNFPRIKSFISDISMLNANIQDIIILDEMENRYSLSDGIMYPLPETDLMGTAMEISSLQEMEYYNKPLRYLVAAQNIYSIDSYLQTNSRIGTLYIILTPDAMTGGKYAVNTSDSVRIHLNDREGDILWSGHEFQDENTRSEKLLSDTSVETFVDGYQIHIYRSNPTLWEILKACSGGVYALYIGVVIFLIVLWSIWVRNVIRPMHQLSEFSEHMGDTGLESLTQKINLEGYEEIHTLSSSINKMMQKIKHLTDTVLDKNKEIYQNQVYAKQAEISYLRSQINPHFLYNTLETMCGIAYSENQPELAKIAKALSLIFKYSIKGKDVVPLKDELKIVKNYILIQSVRFPSRFTTEYQIDDNCMNKQVPKMILQPLIENAITHGLEEQEKLCHLIVGVTADEEKLMIRIADDGIGIQENKLKELQKQLASTEKYSGEKESSHIGIANVHNRIRLLYGEEFGISIKSKAGEGTIVTVTLPLINQ